jgi:hypothetical protein
MLLSKLVREGARALQRVIMLPLRSGGKSSGGVFTVCGRGDRLTVATDAYGEPCGCSILLAPSPFLVTATGATASCMPGAATPTAGSATCDTPYHRDSGTWNGSTPSGPGRPDTDVPPIHALRWGMDVYFTEHLPVLKAAVNLYDGTGRAVQISQLAAETGLDEATCSVLSRHWCTSTRRCSTTGSGAASPRPGRRHSDPTGEARRRIGQWPTAEALAGRPLDVLDEQAEQAAPEDRPRWRRVRDGVVSGGRDVRIEVVAAALTRAMGL